MRDAANAYKRRGLANPAVRQAYVAAAPAGSAAARVREVEQLCRSWNKYGRLRARATEREWRARVMLRHDGSGPGEGAAGAAPSGNDVLALSARPLDWGALSQHFSRDVKQRLRKLGYAVHCYYKLGLNDEGIRSKYVTRGADYARFYERLRAEMNEYNRVYRGEAKRVKAMLLAEAEAKAASKRDGSGSEGAKADDMADEANNRNDLARGVSVAGENGQAQNRLELSGESILLR